METNIKYIRKTACDILLQYRATYNLYRTWKIVNDNHLTYMYNQYFMLRCLYYCCLISSSSINRAYYMYAEIKEIKIKSDRGVNECQ